MDSPHWKQIEKLFFAARLLKAEERTAFLQQACGGDQNLCEEVLSLLEVDARGGLLEPTTTLATAHIPEILAGRFRIIRHIGKGGMGDVYEAEDLRLKERVALKTIRSENTWDSLAVERFRREIVLAKKVTHPNVCRIHDLGFHVLESGAEMPFLTMEFLGGETLSSRIRRGPMPAEEAAPLIADMADALAAAHRAGVVHRDFKSANVMLVNTNGRERATVTDFGLARAVRENERAPLTKPGTAPGTVAYMAPEQVKGEEVTPAADIYALGVVMYEMLTGTRPFRGDSDVSIALKHINDPPRPPRQLAPSLDPKWDGIVLRCLEKEPRARFESAEAVKAGIALGHVKPSRPRFGRRRAAALIIALVVLGALLAGWLLRPSLPPEKRVAVLKFENIGGDPANQAFCDGLMETLTGSLTQLEAFQGSLEVVPAADVRKEKVSSASDAQRAFHVNLVVTGSVQRSSDGLHLIINLVDPRRLKQLRSDQISVPLSDAVSMQQGVVKLAAGLLDIELHPQAQHRLAQGNTASPGAYDFYVQGQGYLSGRKDGSDQAILEFQHALDLDPRYPLAYAGLGEAYWRKYRDTRDARWVDQAWKECRKAIELDPQLPAAHITLAVLNSGTGHYDEAIRQARQAIEIDPGNYEAHAELASALEATQQAVEAEATWKKAIQLRPGYWRNYIGLGTFYFNQNRYKEAEAPFSRVIELVPDNPAGYTNLGVMYLLEGREADAELMLKQSINTRPTPDAYSNLATVYFSEGRYADAVPIMENLVANGTNKYLIWGNLGDAYRWTAGNAAKARKAYSKAIQMTEQDLRVNPHDASALSAQALYRAKVGDTAAALATSAKAMAASPSDSDILYDAAIVSEIARKRDKALKYLAQAIRAGHSLKEINSDPELATLRQGLRYRVIITNREVTGKPAPPGR